MDPKEERGTGRDQLAARLHQIADMIRSGDIRVAQASTIVPEDIKYQIELDEEPDKNKFDLEIEIERPAA